MAEASEKHVLKFLKDLMEIQRHYSNELKNAKTNRQEDVRDLLEKSVAKEAANAD